MDWKDEEVKDVYEVAQKLGRFMDFESLRAIMTRAVELAAARGGTMTAEELDALAKSWHGATIPEAFIIRKLLGHISTLNARVAVLEAENKRFTSLIMDTGKERDAAKEEAEHLRERLSAAEEGNRELVRRAQQAEALVEHERRNMESWRLMADRMRERLEEAQTRCATLSAAGQVLRDMGATAEDLAHYSCSPACTHDNAAKSGHPELVRLLSGSVAKVTGLDGTTTEVMGADRVTERSEAFSNIATPDSHPESFPARADDDTTAAESDAYERGAEAMRAACWEAAQAALQRMGLSKAWSETGDVKTPLWEALKSAIEGAAP